MATTAKEKVIPTPELGPVERGVQQAQAMLAASFEAGYRRELLAFANGDYAEAQAAHEDITAGFKRIGPIGTSLLPLIGLSEKPRIDLTVQGSENHRQPSRRTQKNSRGPISPERVAELMTQEPIRQFMTHPDLWTTTENGGVTLKNLIALGLLLTHQNGDGQTTVIDLADGKSRRIIGTFISSVKASLPPSQQTLIKEDVVALIGALDRQTSRSKTYSLRTSPISEEEFQTAQSKKK